MVLSGRAHIGRTEKSEMTKDTYLHMRLSESDKLALKALAEEKGLTVAALVRTNLLHPKGRKLKKQAPKED